MLQSFFIALIHRSAWKGYSQKFARTRSTEFGQEVAIISQMRPVLPRTTLLPLGDEMRSEAVFRLVTDL